MKLEEQIKALEDLLAITVAITAPGSPGSPESLWSEKAKPINDEIFYILEQKETQGLRWGADKKTIVFETETHTWQIITHLKEIYILQKHEKIQPDIETSTFQFQQFHVEQIFVIIDEKVTNIGYSIESEVPLKEFPEFITRRIEQITTNYLPLKVKSNGHRTNQKETR